MNAAPKFSTEKYERFAPQKYNDLYCAAIFVVHMLIVVFSIDLSGGAAQLVAWERAGEGEVVAFAGVKKVESAGFLSEMHLFGHALKVSSLPGFVLTALLIALILSMMWLLAVKFMPVRMTYFSLWACAVMCFTLGAYGLMKGQLFGGVIGILVACFIVWMIFFDKRIEFTAGMIEQVATLLLSRPELLAIVFLMTVVKIGWMFVCITSLMGKGALYWVVMLFCFYWSSEVFSNVIHVTAAGTVARWYHNEDVEKPMQHAFTHAWTYHLGSICLGSALVAFLQTIQAIVKQFEEDTDNIVSAVLACCATCILNCLESLVRMFNYWAFCIIAIWSPTFCEAGGIVMEFVEEENCFLQAISSVCVVDLVTMMANIGVGLVDAVICVSLAFGAGTETKTIYLYGIIAFIFGFLVNSVGGRVIESGVGGIFTCATADRLVMKERCKDLEVLFNEHFPCQFERPRRF